jgi:hypothetical protein
MPKYPRNRGRRSKTPLTDNLIKSGGKSLGPGMPTPQQDKIKPYVRVPRDSYRRAGKMGRRVK